MGGTIEYKWWGNARCTPWMYYQMERLDADMRRLFGVGLVGTSGIRTAQEQLDIFLLRYVTAGKVNGRKVYDTRVWNGARYYRISSYGTVAVPSFSNHEIQGTQAAVDIQDTGNDAGIKSAGSVRGRWIRANAWRYDLIADGDNFGEGWHFTILNIFKTPPTSGGAKAPLKEDGMTATVRLNKTHLFTIGEEFISHNVTLAQADVTRAINSAADEQHELNFTQFVDYLDGMGIPRNVVDGNKGEVFNPQSGKFERNGTWSRRREAVAKADQALTELAKLVKAIKP